ncbi:WD40-repeat-containing domain protein [Rhizoctonia solani]|nr:WD40-repeat-containing domain protein [Rhizoctonia solani]
MLGHYRSPLAARHKQEDFLLKMLAGGFKYSRSLFAHTNCVNAIAFSKYAGRWMASAGDDTNLFLWDTFQDNFHISPVPVFRLETEARKNVLAAAFNAFNDKVYFVGTQSQFVEYDISRLTSGQNQGVIPNHSSHPTMAADQASQFIDLGRGNSVQYSRNYEDTIFSVSPHPTHPSLVMTAGEEGLVRLHDLRSPGTGFPSMEGRVVRNSEINDAQWCPTPGASHSFVVAQQDGNVCLMDSRMAISTSIDPIADSDPKNVIQRYATWVSKAGFRSCWAPEPSSVTFSSDGMRMAITLKNFTPVLYDTFEVFPLTQLCAFPGNVDSPTVGSYANNCTIKHGSFGGAGLGLPEDSIYCAGSDDFRVYAWAIPSGDALRQTARCLKSELWLSETDASHMGTYSQRVVNLILPTFLWFFLLHWSIGFVTPDDLRIVSVPPCLSQPDFWLGGHRSVVNTAAFHPTLPLIFTSGVENHIQLHSVRPLPGSQLSEAVEATRVLPPSSLLSRISFRASTYGVETLSQEEIRLYRRIPRQERTVLMFDEYVLS